MSNGRREIITGSSSRGFDDPGHFFVQIFGKNYNVFFFFVGIIIVVAIDNNLGFLLVRSGWSYWKGHGFVR